MDTTTSTAAPLPAACGLKVSDAVRVGVRAVWPWARMACDEAAIGEEHLRGLGLGCSTAAGTLYDFKANDSTSSTGTLPPIPGAPR